MKKRPVPPKPKRPPGRPRKNGRDARVFMAAWVPAGLMKNLDEYVLALKKTTSGTSRGDVVKMAVEAYPPFREWLQRKGAK